MDRQLLTVIVACYNVADLVGACLRSLLEQPAAGCLRIIAVDDGSSDATGQAIRAEIAAHPGIDCEVLVQANQGLSGARNAGLSRVRTPYVAFVDGDDLWSPDFLATILPALERHEADIIGFNAAIVSLAGQRVDGLRTHACITRGRARAAADMAADAAHVGEWEAWARVYRTSLFAAAPFPVRRYYEDTAVIPGLYLAATRVATYRQELYYYRRRPGSITSCVTDKHVDDLLQTAREAIGRQPGLYWGAVARTVLLIIARQIGRAPAAQRGPMTRRALPVVLSVPGAPTGWSARWWASLANVALRTDTKAMLEWMGVRRASS